MSYTSIKTTTGQYTWCQHQCCPMNGSLAQSVHCETVSNASNAFNSYWSVPSLRGRLLRTEPATDLPSQGGGGVTDPTGQSSPPLVQPSLPSDQPSVSPEIPVTDDPTDETRSLSTRDEDSDSDDDQDEDEEENRDPAVTTRSGRCQTNPTTATPAACARTHGQIQAPREPPNYGVCSRECTLSQDRT
jgi:hypothetical protein